MEIGKYKTLSTNVLYLQREDLSNVSIQKELKEIESNDCIIIDNLSKTRSIRTTQHYQVTSGI